MLRGRLFILILFVAIGFSSCHENGLDKYHELTPDEILAETLAAYGMDSATFVSTLDSIMDADKDKSQPARHARAFYAQNHRLLWIFKDGLNHQADTLNSNLERTSSEGIAKEYFEPGKFQVDSVSVNNFVEVDYYLTKAYLKYVAGERYGYIDPYKLFNNLDYDKYDSTKTKFHDLYDIDTEKLDDKGYEHLLSMIETDSVAYAVGNAEQTTGYYRKLKQMLAETTNSAERRKILVNMERARWRHKDNPEKEQKYVLVNIPAYELRAVDGSERLGMKIVCGAWSTKTPLVHSRISRMDLNPRWSMPSNVVKHEVSVHAGDSAYFARNRYVVEDKNGKQLVPEQVPYDQFKKGLVRVWQQGGEGNALGRIIFRFPNNFSIYLHDTSNKGAFAKADRRMSHGCVRVEKPYELAEFLLPEKNERVLEKIQYSMNVLFHQTEEEGGREPLDKKKLIHSWGLEPQIPIFVTYYTLYEMEEGVMKSLPDVYGYDEVMWEELSKLRVISEE